jgi:hypothetical protein
MGPVGHLAFQKTEIEGTYRMNDIAVMGYSVTIRSLLGQYFYLKCFFSA